MNRSAAKAVIQESAAPHGGKAPWGARLRTIAADRTLQIALLGSALLFASLPPLGMSLLAWIAPVPWFWLARQRELPGPRPYCALYAAGLAFWLAVNYWLCMPHWATSFGWIALCIYHAVLPPMVVGFARVARSRFGLGIVVTGPVLWVAFDEARAYLFTGFSMASLCHSQYRVPSVIQFADLCGEFGVTFFLTLFAAGIAQALPTRDDRRFRFAPLLASVAAVGALLGYGTVRLRQDPDHFAPGPKIALIQGSIDSDFKYDPTKPQLIYEHYMKLSREALAADPSMQLVVWPETMFPFPWMLFRDDAAPPADADYTLDDMRERSDNFRNLVSATARALDRPLLLGISTTIVGPGTFEGYNSALFVDRAGEAGLRYDKQHRVIFGEYVPLAKTFPFLYKFTPLTGGTEAGTEAKSLEFAGARLAPSICYETALARVIRRQVAELRDRGEEPDVLVNVTNDGWFWGSSELDLHLACAVFRAVEMRKPLVVAANTGFSAHIDSDGRILAQGPRQATGFINAATRIDRRRSPYLAYGDWLAQTCFVAAVILGLIGIYDRRRRKSGEL